MQRAARVGAVLFLCVLLAGCSWSGASAPTAEYPQTTVTAGEPDPTTTTAATESPPSGLVVRNDADEQLDVDVRITDVSNETVLHEETYTLAAGDAHYLDHVVREHSQYRVIVSVANASLSRSVFGGQYNVVIENRSAVFGHETDT